MSRPRKGFWRRNFKRGHFAFHDTTLDIYHSAADMSANRSPASSINIQGLLYWILSGAPFIVWVQLVLCMLELMNDEEFCLFFFSPEAEKLRFFYMCAKMKLPDANWYQILHQFQMLPDWDVCFFSAWCCCFILFIVECSYIFSKPAGRVIIVFSDNDNNNNSY